MISKEDIAKYIDHTLLKPTASDEELKKLCEEAKQYHFASVCVNPCNIRFCKKILDGSGVKVCTVVGFPLGQMTTEAKVGEAIDAIVAGADEVDMVLNIAALKQKKRDIVTNDIKRVKVACKTNENILKVIIETCLLNTEEKIMACDCVTAAGADFIKTSTGFSTGGATVEDVKLLKQHVGPNVKVKASGGISNKEQAIAMIDAGADRLGTSHGVDIVK